MRLLAGGVAAALMLALWQAPARANDSMAEVAIGGLVLKDSDQIAIDKEALYLSANEVRVDYLFTNTSSEDIETTMVFPLPDQQFDDLNEFIYKFHEELDFRTTVDGEPAAYDVKIQAIINGEDMTAELAALGLDPFSPSNSDGFGAALRALAPDQLEHAIRRGIIKRDSTSYASTVYLPRWKIRTTVTRTQLFPAGRTIAVSHRYKPVRDGAFGGWLNAEFRNSELGEQHARDYCIGDGWFAAFDKALAKRATAADAAPYGERWLTYVFSADTSWKRPVKDFQLVVDKGKPENMVSFCAEGVEKIGPTQFEVRKSDFEPENDVKVTIVEWYKPGE